MTETDAAPAAEPSSADFVQSLARGLAVIRAFDGEPSTARGAAEDVRAELLPALQQTASRIEAELRAVRL